jgi:nitrile hydratase subunit beta
MNGIHDMGGMHGFGLIAPEPDEPVFHEPWEARMFGMRQAMTFPPGTTIDRRRFEREKMPPIEYLRQSYYEHWYFASTALLVEYGDVTRAELRSGRAVSGFARRMDAMPASAVASPRRADGKTRREVSNAPRFAKGQSIATRNLNPEGHTRLPRYARGKRGVIHVWRGAHLRRCERARRGRTAPACRDFRKGIMGRRGGGEGFSVSRSMGKLPWFRLSRRNSPSHGKRRRRRWRTNLCRPAGFTPAEWADALGEAIKRFEQNSGVDDGSNYYRHVLGALEALSTRKSLLSREMLDKRKEAWAEAYEHTPHGKPVTLPQ